MAIQAQMYPDNLMGNPFGGSQDWLMDNNNSNLFFFNGGSGLNDLGFNLQQQQQQQQVQLPYQQQQQYLVQFQNLQQRNHNHNQSLASEHGFVFFPSSKNNYNNNNNAPTTSTITTTSSDNWSMNLSQSLAAQLEKQSLEINRFITLQNERLKLGLQEQRKRQVGTILRKVEAKARVLLKEKDEEIAKARKRGMDLEEYVRKMERESEAWQRVAAEKEAMVVSLNNTLEQLRQHGLALASSNGNGNGNGELDDAQSCCDDNDYTPAGNDGREDEEETGIAGGGERNMMMMKMVCRFCNTRKSCMLLLPCRHLCSCKACEPFIDACPLCKSPKSTSIQALFS